MANENADRKITVRIAPAVYDRLCEIADAEDLTVSQVVRRSLRTLYGPAPEPGEATPGPWTPKGKITLPGRRGLL